MAIELLVEGLAGAERDLDHTGFYTRLAEVVARIGAMKRTVIFLFDESTRRVQVAGAHGIELEPFSGVPISLDLAPDAARALAEDRVIEVRPPQTHRIPPAFAELVGGHPLVYVPIAAAHRWPGVMIAEPIPGAPPLDDARRELLWTVGKTLALASVARTATYYGERARELEERIDLARDIHDSVVQRLFGVSMALTPSGALDDHARERCAEEVGMALEDLRAAIQRPLGRPSRATGTTLAAELQRLMHAGTDLDLRIDGDVAAVPPALEPLVQSVLAEAMRNVQKHAHANAIVVRAYRTDGVFVLEVENDGVAGRPHDRPPGMGLKLAALEALHAGGLLEFGQRTGGHWQVRLAVPERQL
jgi:signal transduction histidine kinase